MTAQLSAHEKPFRLEEATIEELHAAITSGQTTCVAIVQHYIDRARAYNGVASVLVTADGAPISEATGAVRAQAPLRFPTATVKASTILPDLDQYTGPPLEFGRMEATASDPAVQQQFGMIVGMPHAGQVNALATLNIRGERSVTCRGDFDRHPSEGPLPPGAPPVCETFRQLPDALERAAELDATYGRHPDLEKMPMYGVVFSFKDPFDTKDMRSTGGGDARYDIDFPARDHVLVEQLRNKGAIIFAKAVNTEYNGRAGDPGGRHTPEQGAAVDARLSAQHLGRQSRQPLRHDTRGLARLEFGLGGVGQHQSGDGQPRRGNAGLLPRTGQPQCRGADPAAQVAARLQRRRHRRGHLLRSQRHPLPHDRRLRQSPRRPEGPGRRLLRSARSLHDRAALVSVEHAIREPRDRCPGAPGALKGMRLGIIRESMVYLRARRPKQPIVTAAAQEIKTILGDRLGATLVESSDPLWQPGSRYRDHADRFPARPGQAGAGLHARAAVPAGAGRSAPSSRSSRQRSCRPSSCPARSSARAPCSRSTIASSWRKDGSHRLRTSISPPSSSRSWRWRSGSISRNT